MDLDYCCIGVILSHFTFNLCHILLLIGPPQEKTCQGSAVLQW